MPPPNNQVSNPGTKTAERLLMGLLLVGIAVGCALGYLDFRFPQITWRETYPNLGKLHDKLALRPSFVETAPK